VCSYATASPDVEALLHVPAAELETVVLVAHCLEDFLSTWHQLLQRPNKQQRCLEFSERMQQNGGPHGRAGCGCRCLCGVTCAVCLVTCSVTVTGRQPAGAELPSNRCYVQCCSCHKMVRSVVSALMSNE